MALRFFYLLSFLLIIACSSVETQNIKSDLKDNHSQIFLTENGDPLSNLKFQIKYKKQDSHKKYDIALYTATFERPLAGKFNIGTIELKELEFYNYGNSGKPCNEMKQTRNSENISTRILEFTKEELIVGSYDRFNLENDPYTGKSVYFYPDSTYNRQISKPTNLVKYHKDFERGGERIYQFKEVGYIIYDCQSGLNWNKEEMSEELKSNLASLPMFE